MTGEKNLNKLLKSMKPVHIPGEYVFCVVDDLKRVNLKEILFLFKEVEGITIILNKENADNLKFEYFYIASWITLTVHSSLEAVGLTSAFSTALANEGISCNVVAAYYHDHIFVNKKDTEKAMQVLNSISG
jgi:uncharacterized protein